MLIDQGWLSSNSRGVIKTPSAFFNERPQGISIDTLVIHNISLPPGEFGSCYVEQLFLGCLNPQAHPALTDLAGLEVSSHLFIHRDGQVQQFVSFEDRAWHAGQSHWLGRDNCNDFSIGIELEGADSIPYTYQQYLVLVKVTQVLLQHYPISQANIVGHSHIAPERKTDPGEAFDWGYFFQAIY